MASGNMRGNKDSTLCWKCAKYCGKCSWSESFTPVEGWEAIPVKVDVGSNGVSVLKDTFRVVTCPQFESDVEKYAKAVCKIPKTIENPNLEVIEQINFIKKTLHISQKDLAYLIGVTPQQLYVLKHKRKKVDPERLGKLQQVYEKCAESVQDAFKMRSR